MDDLARVFDATVVKEPIEPFRRGFHRVLIFACEQRSLDGLGQIFQHGRGQRHAAQALFGFATDNDIPATPFGRLTVNLECLAKPHPRRCEQAEQQLIALIELFQVRSNYLHVGVVERQTAFAIFHIGHDARERIELYFPVFDRQMHGGIQPSDFLFSTVALLRSGQCSVALSLRPSSRVASFNGLPISSLYSCHTARASLA